MATKSIKVTDLGTIKNELNKYKKGQKFTIPQFNEIARLAWLGKVVMQPLDPVDPECQSYLVFVDHPDPLPGHFLPTTDEELVGGIHIVSAEQGDALAKVIERGVHERAAIYESLGQRDFYFDYFYQPGSDEDDADDE
ncbi:MAG TPA: hypothetical protein VKA14_09625 [Gammaproteobacteria bacterium]|nr:hypothetical protein [Gammaproteobacteria bacterium]